MDVLVYWFLLFRWRLMVLIITDCVQEGFRTLEAKPILREEIYQTEVRARRRRYFSADKQLGVKRFWYTGQQQEGRPMWFEFYSIEEQTFVTSLANTRLVTACPSGYSFRTQKRLQPAEQHSLPCQTLLAA